MFPKGRLPAGIETSNVGRRGPLPPKERQPEIVEVAEACLNVYGHHLDSLQPGRFEQLLERPRCAEREALPLVERFGCGVESGGGIPEASRELPPARIVPQVGSDLAPGG